MAELKLVNEGALEALPLDNMTLELFTNDITPSKDSVFADFVFADGSNGDGAKTLSQGSWTASEVSGTVQFEYPEQTWNFTGSGTYYGIAIVTSTNKIYYTSKFSSEWVLGALGGDGSVTPTIQAFSEAILSSPSSSPSASASSSPSISVSSSPSSSVSSSPSSSSSSSTSSSPSSSPSPSGPVAPSNFTEGFENSFSFGADRGDYTVTNVSGCLIQSTVKYSGSYALASSVNSNEATFAFTIEGTHSGGGITARIRTTNMSGAPYVYISSGGPLTGYDLVTANTWELANNMTFNAGTNTYVEISFGSEAAATMYLDEISFTFN